ncbi:hypothetical protein T4E_905 [Trichinella pseudospiralis]|uniref:Uncharacterized protein n=1 Tax=Trichinella pseudospiralis TaxID=6337 RepID=A0A0V0YNL3_TRIPS|nr:hypothetical protein T4E_905 [Trichinella pseudospiralis]
MKCMLGKVNATACVKSSLNLHVAAIQPKCMVVMPGDFVRAENKSLYPVKGVLHPNLVDRLF